MTTPPPPPYPRSPDETEPDNLDEAPEAATESAADDAPPADDVLSPADPASSSSSSDKLDNRRQRWLIIGAVVVAVVVVIGACAGIGIGAVRVVDAVGDGGHRLLRVDDACQALEVRLNRVAPPGSASGPRERATAIRDENAAIKPFLDEITAGRRDNDRDDDRLLAEWTQLVDARTAYADALDRQVSTDAPAFFVAPRNDRGNAVVERLEDRHDDCAASVRRLAAPDL
ncbi:hypothetical protein DFJ67_3090 [Asanoa ferruginea]|uniref:Uncharacterized protein n=1 Tax=Asanoa ferruginea TaxID=53367 RepID=A0A3D9ZII7_9ACTN|nr:hypothetical protein [Asanoa ferruginea]REF97095.1 hypothetical protein DFJ67_3090 [Asanoa ferruginea]GIF50472.1 hypothetical protein Afe04nite_50110 [Asanoa ferruginea]